MDEEELEAFGGFVCDECGEVDVQDSAFDDREERADERLLCRWCWDDE